MSLLQRLAEYQPADETSQLPPYFKTKRVRWALEISSEGALRSTHLTPLGDNPKRPGLDLAVPDMYRSGAKPAALLGCDKVEYVLGWSAPEGRAGRFSPLEAFAQHVDEWVASAPEDAIPKAVQAFYQRRGYEGVQHPPDWTNTDLVVIDVDGIHVTAEPSLQIMWATIVERTKSRADADVRECLVCGERRAPVATFPGGIKSTLVPGATQTVTITSANKEIFGHSPQLKLTNVAICSRCAESTVSKLTHLLEAEEHSERGPSARRGGRLEDRRQDAALVWWIVGPSGAKLDLSPLAKPEPDDVRELIRSVRSGLAPAELNDDQLAWFCGLSVAGNASRLVVREWYQEPLRRVQENLILWFDDHKIAPAAAGKSPFRSLGQLWLAAGRWVASDGRYATPGTGSNDPHRPASLYRGLYRAALRGEPLARSLLNHLLHRIRTDGHVDDARAALLRLAIVRPRTEEPSMPQAFLDESLDDPSYIAGRIMATLATIQFQASRSGSEPNLRFEDRYLAGAIANPRLALVSGRRDATAWLRKVRRDKPGVAVILERRLDELFARIPASIGLPSTVGPAEQARFILGYHQQRNHSIRAAIEAKSRAASGAANADQLAEARLADEAEVVADAEPTEGESR